jgi:GTP-binding protein EngB required for normal cell division
LCCRRTATPENTTEVVEEIAERYGIASLAPLIASCRAFERERTLNVAVVGRFKAGKSSFLNCLIGRALLPVGALPVTSVISEIRYGARERATVRFTDGRTEETPAEAIGAYVDEERNPGNRKGATLASVELPEMARFGGLRFVDTPGLESALAHNTGAAREWLPNAGLAIIAVGVDPPLARSDLELLRQLSRHTPNIWLLLTKVDLLEEGERRRVEDYVREQLRRNGHESVPVFPYSIRPGFEGLRAAFEEALAALSVARERQAILARKLETLRRECAEYLGVALKAAESADAERRTLERKILGEKRALEDSKLALRLIARHAAANSREQFARTLEAHEDEIDVRLLDEFEKRYPAWTRSLAVAARGLAAWLEPAMAEEMTRLAAAHRVDFLEPPGRVGRQLSQALQDFRNRISERTMDALGVPLRTTETGIEAAEPRSPDIRIGRLFDREWELVSFLIPMTLAKGLVRRHFRRAIAGAVFTNLSRLASQWERAVNPALEAMEREAAARMEDLIGTVERLVAAAGEEAPRIREDLSRLETTFAEESKWNRCGS